MKPEKRHLVDDLRGDARRETTLLAGARILRRRRLKRMAAKSFAVFAVAAVAVVAFYPRPQSPVIAQTTPAPQSTPHPARVEYMTDDELLALFPNTPVGLIDTTNGRKQLVFLHPGDEAKFITRF